jgi:hypothetical protein
VLERRRRLQLYAALALGFFLLALAGTRFANGFELVYGDGRGYYVYLPSAVVDHDLDFTNQIQEHWGDGFTPLSLRVRTGTGLVWNKFTIGLALALLPAFLLAHGLALALHAATGSALFAPDGFSPLYQCLCLGMILGHAVATMAIADRWLSERFRVSGRATAGAVVVYWLGTPYAYYAFREAFAAHVVSAFWVAATVAVAIAIHDRLASGAPRRRDLLALSFALAMAIVCRLSNAFVLLVVAGLLLEARRHGRLGGLLRMAPWALPGLLPLALQALVWRLMTGHAITDPYRTETFSNWAHPYLLHTLVSSNHGLFFWSPILLLAAWSVAGRLCQERDAVLVGFTLSFAVLWYVNSSWYAWWFGEAFGARAFLELSALFVVGLGLAFERLRGGVLVALAAIAFNWGLMLAFSLRWIPRQGVLY